MTARRSSAPPPVHPSIPPEKALQGLRKQLLALQTLNGRNFREAEAEEQQWRHLNQRLLERTFGNPSSNLTKFNGCISAGEHYITPYGMSDDQLQRNFGARLVAYESLLKSCIQELEFILPEQEVQGVYEPGEEYAFYRDLKALLQDAKTDALIVDPYLDVQVFDLYVETIESGVTVGVLGSQITQNLATVARKYALRGQFEMRSTSEIHDRVVFIDDRVWLIGQSIKDASKKKPTTIVEFDPAILRKVYEDIWNRAAVVVAS